MGLISEQRLSNGVLERRFLLGDVPGILWTPEAASSVPLILLGHPGGMERMYSRLVGRAQAAAAQGFASVTTELPVIPAVDEARAELRHAIAAGERPSEDVIERVILPLVDQTVPQWQLVMDTVLGLPEVGGPVAISGGVIAIGVRLARAEPRLVAAGLFAGSFVPRSILEEAREVTIPVHVLLQWDDEGNDRQLALDLYDAFGSTEKTLQANLGGHAGVPPWAGEDAGRFFERHLGRRTV